MSLPESSSRPSSPVAEYLRCRASGKPATPPGEVRAIQRKYGFYGLLPRTVVATLLAAFALAVAKPMQAAPEPASEEAVAMHQMPPPPAPEAPAPATPAVETPAPAPAPAPASAAETQAENPDLASPSRLWAADKDILVLGEQHNAAGQSQIMLRDLPYLKAKGMKVFGMELTDTKTIAKFSAGKLDKNGLSRALWDTSYEELPEGFKLKLDMAEWCRDNGVRIACVDANRNLLYECASAQTRALQEGGQGFIDPTGERDVLSRGLHPRHANLTAAEAAAEGWRLWLHERSKSMANIVAKDYEAHGEKMVVLVGAMHTGLTGYREMLMRSGVPVQKTPDAGLEDSLPDAIKSKTQTVLFVGGMNYTGRLEDLPSTGQLHAVESQIIRRGMGHQTLSIKSIQGLGGVDSVIYLPPINKTPAVTVAAANPPARGEPDL